MARTTSKTAKQRAAASTKREQAITPEPTRPSPARRRLLAKPDTRSLRWWFDLGTELLQVHPVPKAGRKRPYRPNIIRDLAQKLHGASLKNAKTTLWQARKLVMRFGTWDKLVKFQGPLSIWHVMTLVAVDQKKGSKSSMAELRKRCIAERWSVDRLKREIQNDRGGKTGSGRQPKLLMAATPAIAIKDLYIAARRWMAYHEQCLDGPRPILTRARPKDYSANLLRDVQRAIEGLVQVQKAVTEEVTQLIPLAKNIKDYSANLLRNIQKAIEGLMQVQKTLTEELAQLIPLAKNIKSARKD
jgi:DNA-binding ferritin-like protein